MMYFDKITKMLVKHLMRVLLARIGFRSDVTYGFSYQDECASLDSVTTGEHPRLWILIVAREHYFESVKDYPIGDLKDLKSIISQEPWNFPYQGEKFVHFERLSPQSFQVTTWVVKEDVYSSLVDRPLLLIPETAAMAAVLGQGAVEYTRLGETVQLSKTVDGLRSKLERSECSEPVESEGTLAPAVDFRFLGSETFEKLEGKQFPLALAKGVWALIKAAPLRFRMQSRSVDYPWRALGKVASFTVLTYLALSSAYISLAGHFQETRIDRLTAKVQPVSAWRRSSLDYQNQLNVISGALQAVKPNWILGDLSLDLIKEGVTIRSVRSENSDVVLFLAATKATDVLAFLAKDKRVKEVEYAFPVQQVSNQQQFALKIVLDAQRSTVRSSASVISSEAVDG